MDVDEHDNANIDDPRYATNVVSASKKMMVMMMVMMMVVMMILMIPGMLHMSAPLRNAPATKPEREDA